MAGMTWTLFFFAKVRLPGPAMVLEDAREKTALAENRSGGEMGLYLCKSP